MRTIVMSFFLALISLSMARAADQPLNIIVVDICSARADHFSLYGYERDTTPKMTALAKDGVVFDRAMAQSSWCRPNYASLFTGNVPELHGLYTNLPGPLPWFETPLAERLKNSGYRTAAFSGGVYLLKEFGLTRGFDKYANNFSTAPSARIPASVDDSLEGAETWLKQNRKEPTFLYLAIDDMHVPYHSDDPEKYDPGYTGPADSTMTRSVPFYRAYNGEAGGYDAVLKTAADDFKRDPRNLKHLIAHYDAAVNYVDRRVGELVDKLKSMGLWDRTILVVTGDHGEMLGEKKLLGHTQSLYEPVLHVPLLIRHPGFGSLAGKRFGQLVERVDLMPTLLDFAGATYDPVEFQGRSLQPLFRDPSAPWRSYAFAASKRDLSALGNLDIEERVVRDGRWKLHHYLYKDGYELYDLEADPYETTDVAPIHPEIVARLSFQLIEFMERNRPHAPGPVQQMNKIEFAAPPRKD